MKNKFSVAMSLALVLALLAATIALADNLFSDGDGLAPVVNAPSLALGNVCLGSTTIKPIDHAINRNGNYPGTNVFAKNATVIVSVGTVTGSGLSASGGGSITIPSNWDTVANNTLSPSVSSSVTFVANTLGAFSGIVNYNAVGTRSSSGTLTRSDELPITATVVNCDTMPPDLHVPDNMAVEATGPSGALITFSVSASDTNPLSPTVTCVPASPFTLAVDGATTVNCSATDAAGNMTSKSFNVNVVDTTDPTILPPSSIVAEATSGSGAVVSYSGEYATDLVDGTISATCSPASGSAFPLGLNTVTCSATDAHGNTGSSDFTIDVQDTQGPILALPADLTEEAASGDGAVVSFSVSASDLVDGEVPVTCDWSDGDTFPLGTTLVTCSATDSNSNTSGGTFNVTVDDTTAPELILPADFAVEATSSAGAVATYDAYSLDLVDGSVLATCAPASGDIFPLGATKVECSSTDAAGNSATGSFIVTVQDTTAAELTLPADQQLEATSAAGAVAAFTASATDAVDGALTVTCSANSGHTFPLGTTTVNCSVSDAAGNEASGSFVIIVEDTTAPTITFVSRTPANGNGWNNGNVTVNWSCSDIVGVVSASVSATVSTEGANQSATGTCKDTSGNEASDTLTGINIDKTKPSASASRAPDANSFGWNNSDVTVSFSGEDDLSGIDFCSDDQVFGEGADQFASGTCTDEAGNVSDAVTVLNINVDKTAPTISGAPDRDPNAHNWYKTDVTVSFTCDDDLSGVDECSDPTTLDEGAAQSVTGNVTDKAGNSASDTVSDINIDKTDPVITAALDKTPAPNGWFNGLTGVPTVSFECSDALSGLDGACPSDHTFGEGENQSYSQTIYDLAGNGASDDVSDVDVDTVAPFISAAVSPARPGSGWWNLASGAPEVTYYCSDGTSGLTSCTAAHTFSEGEDQAHSGTAVDNAGNSSTTGVSDIDVDLTAPVVIVTPARGTDYNGWYNAPVSFAFSATDGTSGVASCDPNVNYNGSDSATANVSGSCTDTAGNPGSASVVFKYDNTDPSITASVAPSASGNGWWNVSTGAPTASFVCSDAIANIESCEGPHTFGNGENQSFTGSVKDNAGNTNSAGVSNIDVDLNAPSISVALDRSPAGSGWFNASTGAPTVEFTCSDTGSSNLASCPLDYFFGQGANQSHSGTAYDNAGNSASAGVSDVDVDTILPSISVALDRSPAGTGWFNENTGAPTAKFTCSDATSDLAGTCPADYAFPEGADQSHAGTIFDNAGNSNSASVASVYVDLTDPSITWNIAINNGDAFYFGSVPAYPPNPCVAADSLSGPSGCNVTGYGTIVGSHIMVAASQDVAGNQYSEQRTYTVMAWTPRGFYQPVDMGNVWNTVKNGSTVPLKFEVFAGTTELTDVSVVKSLAMKQVACTVLPGAVEDVIETLAATGSTVLRYDSTGGQFIFNWKTPVTPNKCYQVTMTAQDGSPITAFFKLK